VSGSGAFDAATEEACLTVRKTVSGRSRALPLALAVHSAARTAVRAMGDATEARLTVRRTVSGRSLTGER